MSHGWIKMVAEERVKLSIGELTPEGMGLFSVSRLVSAIKWWGERGSDS